MRNVFSADMTIVEQFLAQVGGRCSRSFETMTYFFKYSRDACPELFARALHAPSTFALVPIFGLTLSWPETF